VYGNTRVQTGDTLVVYKLLNASATRHTLLSCFKQSMELLKLFAIFSDWRRLSWSLRWSQSGYLLLSWLINFIILKLSIQWTMQYQQDDYRTILNMKLILTDLTANYKSKKKCYTARRIIITFSGIRLWSNRIKKSLQLRLQRIICLVVIL